MNKPLKISQKVRKTVTLGLMLNFILSTILFSVPAEKCNGLCNIDLEFHTCADMEMDMTKSCCDMMGMTEEKSNSCNMEISDISCDYEFISSSNYTFLIPKTVDSKIVLAEIFTIVIDVKPDNSKTFILSQDAVPDIIPPIYLTVSSFLI